MHVTAWSNGRPTSAGAGYGVRIGKQDRDRYFDRRWSEIAVDLDGTAVPVSLSVSFWNRCSELRSAAIGRWLLDHQLAPWHIGRPPRLVLRRVAEARFELRPDNP
jgi:hypothetical protein